MKLKNTIIICNTLSLSFLLSCAGNETLRNNDVPTGFEAMAKLERLPLMYPPGTKKNRQITYDPTGGNGFGMFLSMFKKYVDDKGDMIRDSQVIYPQSTGQLPVIDFSKDYPKIEQRLQDIAEIEYIPLETTNNVLLSDQDVLSYVSDKYILIYSPARGDIFVFNRTGKLYSHFNHKGQSGQDYSLISAAGVIMDEKNEEIFVCSKSIQVYTLKGEYKRTLKKNTIQDESKVYNFDDESLLVYDDVIVDPNIESKNNTNPYSLISKIDGNVIYVFEIHLPERYTTRIAQMSDNKNFTINQIYVPYFSMFYGQDFVIADISSDTLYLLSQDKELTPLLVRNPSVHISEPRIVWITLLTTDKFILFGKLTLDFNSRGGRIPIFMYEFETNETKELTISDTEFDRRRWAPGLVPAMPKNMTAELIWPSSMIDAYKKKKLNEDFEKLAITLKEDDNPIVRIVKFK